jgi:hypothetical protein
MIAKLMAWQISGKQHHTKDGYGFCSATWGRNDDIGYRWIRVTFDDGGDCEYHILYREFPMEPAHAA